MKVIERIIYILIILGLVVYSIQKPIVSLEYSTIPGDAVFGKIYIDSLISYDTTIYDVDTLWMHDTVFKPTDTAKILADYFKMYEYKIDTNISDVDVSVNSFVTQNRLYKQNLSIKNNRETIIQSINNNGLYVGGIVGKDILSPTISYQYKNHNFGIGYNVVSNNGVTFKYEYKLKLKW